MVTTLSNVWGPEATLKTLRVWPTEWIRDQDRTLRGWLVNAAPEILPSLLAIRSDIVIERDVYFILGYIVEEKAVPAADQSAIIRTVISDFDTDPNGPDMALINIAVLGGADRKTVDTWTTEDWTAWADVQGY